VLNLNQLAQFLSIARTESLTAAAEELDVTPAALSKSLANLEREIDARLFDRIGRGLQLTGTGALFADQVTELLGYAESVSASVKAFTEGSVGRVRIGSGPAALQGPVSALANLAVATYPGIALEIESGRTSELLLGLRQHRYDFLVTDGGDAQTSAEVGQYLIAPLPAEPLVLVCSRKHPLAARRRVRLSEALEYPWATPHVPLLMRNRIAHQLRDEKAPVGAFTRLAAIPDVRIEDMNSCMQVAAGSHCLAATLKSTATGDGFHQSLKVVPVNLNVWTSMAVISLKRRTPTPPAAGLMAALTARDGREKAKGGRPAIR